MFNFDRTLRAHAPLQRYTSLSDAGLDFMTWDVPTGFAERVEHFRAMLSKQLQAKFKKPQIAPSPMGQLINVDEALEGVPECFRHTRNIKPLVRIGVNLSASGNTPADMYPLRAAATIALYQFARSRGQNVQFDICYGNGLSQQEQCHIRIAVPVINIDMVSRIMASDKCRNATWSHYDMWKDGAAIGFYRFYEFAQEFNWKEFDLVLDRIESPTIEIEYQKIIKQIEHLI